MNILNFKQEPKSTEELVSQAKGSIMAAAFLCKSKEIKDAFLLRSIIENLHQERRHNPNNERLISTAIFKIHDMAYYRASKDAKRFASVGTISGFYQSPTKNMGVLKQLMDRMAMVNDPKDIYEIFRLTTDHIINVYAQQNYQSKDKDLKIAYRLKALLLILSDSAKNRADRQWVHDAAVTLETIQPKFKGLSKIFPEQEKRRICSKNIPSGEAPIVPQMTKFRRGSFSDQYE